VQQAIPPARDSVKADVTRLVDVYGNRVHVVRIFRSTVPYLTRGVVERHFSSVPDKVFRASISALVDDETSINDLSGDFDMSGNQHLVDASAEELRFLKLADVVGNRSSAAQLLSLLLVAALAHKHGALARTIDGLLDAAFAAPRRCDVSPSEARELLAATVVVIPMPANLPDALTACPDGPYAIALSDHATLAKQLESFGTWSQAPVQPSRGGAAVADATKDNTVQAARIMLGFAKNVMLRDGEPDLRWLLNGELIASYVSWAGATRKKKPLSLSLEVSSSIRILDFLGASLRMDAVARADLDHLKVALRRLASQLNGIHRPVTSIPELEAVGKWADFNLVQEKVAAEAASVLRACEDKAARTGALARRVHDCLLMCLVTKDCAPNRPGCLRILKMPEAQAGCECGEAACVGNRFVASTMFLSHSKTSRSRDAIRVNFSGTDTDLLLQQHALWARDLLLSDEAPDTDAIWINSRGTPFASDEAFSSYLPRILAKLDLPHLSFTTLRHAAIVDASDWASREELEGMARSIGTSVRKIKEVYDYKCVERSSARFITAFRERGCAGVEAAAEHTVMPTAPPQGHGLMRRFVDMLTCIGGGGGVEVAPAAPRAHLPVIAPPLMGPSTEEALAVSDMKKHTAQSRKVARVDAGASFADFLASRKRINTGGPGRSAAPVQRWLTREQAEHALSAGLSTQRSAYAYAYGFECTSGNLKWLRRKIEDAIEEADNDA